MSDIEYFSTFEESIEILRALMAEGLRLIVQPEFADTPNATTFKSVDDTATRILERAPVFFLAGPFTHHDVTFTQVSGARRTASLRSTGSLAARFLNVSRLVSARWMTCRACCRDTFPIRIRT